MIPWAMKVSSNSRHIKPTKFLFFVSILLLIVDLVALFFLSENAPGSVLAIFGFLLILAPVLLLIGIIMLIITRIKTKRIVKIAQEEKVCSARILLVRERKTGEIIDRAEIEEATPGNRLGEELSIIADLLKNQLQVKYPSDKYEIILEMQQKKEEQVKEGIATFRMVASARSLFSTNLGGTITGVVLLCKYKEKKSQFFRGGNSGDSGVGDSGRLVSKTS